MGFFKNILGLGPSVDYKDLMSKGALIIDVRSKAEYQGGHIKGSTNIPLPELQSYLSKIPKTEKPIITCCASGMRSESAKKTLEKNGYSEVYNGGSWFNLQGKLY